MKCFSLVPAESMFTNEVDLSIKLAKNIKLNVPINECSKMDTLLIQTWLLLWLVQGGLVLFITNMSAERTSRQVEK